MKNYRIWVPIGLIALMVASWYMLISNTVADQNVFNKYLETARQYSADGIINYAVDNYQEAIALKPSPELYAEVAEVYSKYGKLRDYQAWCASFLDAYPTEPVAYEWMLQANLRDEAYESCFDVLRMAEKRGISSAAIQEVAAQLRYVYKFDFYNYDDVTTFSNNFCAVLKDGGWGFVTRYGDQRISTKYQKVGSFTAAPGGESDGNSFRSKSLAPVTDSDGKVYLIDKTGAQAWVPHLEITSLGLLVDEKMAAQLPSGKYTYINLDSEILFGEYDYAGTFNLGVAAVRNGSAWSLVDSKGNPISDTTYVDVKLDSKEIAFRNDRAFVATAEGRYVMIDTKGNVIGSEEYEDAFVFASTAPTAVKQGGKWFFIDKDGKRISEKTYDGARAFCNDLAGVRIDGRWGFVDTDENLVIETKFYDVRDFNEKGSCFVQVLENQWQLLELYRLNRED
ncbi:MAG: WG repeat-containing protein [Lachnospiraceae bacterium]|nr:WG repeat-containing protein [Lachnospiraceae bacterium]